MVYPEKDFYAVIFSSVKSDDLEGYAEMDEETMRLATAQPGFIGYESVASGNRSIFISYWQDMEAINNWRRHSTHLMAKAQAEKWYLRYLSQICRVESSREHVLQKNLK
jgi:heme-degrading monooxygenase HmoA